MMAIKSECIYREGEFSLSQNKNYAMTYLINPSVENSSSVTGSVIDKHGHAWLLLGTIGIDNVGAIDIRGIAPPVGEVSLPWCILLLLGKHNVSLQLLWLFKRN